MISARSRFRSGAVAALLLAAGARADVLHVPADFPTIDAAVAAAHSGDEILLAPGNYDQPVLLDFANNIVLRGQGQAVLGGGTAMAPALSLTNCSNVTIDHLRVQSALGTGVSVFDSTFVTLSKLQVDGCSGDGIFAGEVLGVVVDRCLVTSAGGDGIEIGLAGSCTVSRCTVEGANQNGINLSTEVADSTVESCRVVNAQLHGIALGSADPIVSCSARKNVVIGAGSSAVFSRGTDNVISDNHLLGSALAGIVLQVPSNGGLVAGNSVIGCAGGITLFTDGVLLHKNRVTKSTAHGILCQGDGCFLDHELVVKPAGDAFAFDGSVSGGHVVGCRAVHAGDDGFDVDCAGVTFTGNSATSATDFGFIVTGTANVFALNSAHASGTNDLLDSAGGNTYLDNDLQIVQQ